MRWSRRWPVLSGVSVAIPPRTPLLPEECACCGLPSTHRVAIRRHDATSLLVGYCDECADHQASAASRVLSLSLASLLLGLVTAAGAPLVAEQASLLGLVFAACFASLVPLAFLLLPRPKIDLPHAAHARAVIEERGAGLWCASEGYGARVATLNEAVARPAAKREPLGSPWLSAGPLVAIGAACLAYFVFHPLLRIVNLGSTRIEVAVDGVRLALVDATSNESPSAGALVRVPAGQHVLTVKSAVDGALLARAEVGFRSGAVHLFAPGADTTCFWLETTGYGEQQLQKPSVQPLAAADHFWVLPGGIDTWFAANPASADPSSHSSGGLLTALRQAPCAEAPPEARSPE